MKYQEQGVVNIPLTKGDREAFALGWLPGFALLRTIEGGEYKTRTCLTTICLRESDDTWWAFQWSEDTELIGTEHNDYTMYSYIYQVRPVGFGTTGAEWDWVKVR